MPSASFHSAGLVGLACEPGPQPPAIQGASLNLLPVGLSSARQATPQRIMPCPNCAAYYKEVVPVLVPEHISGSDHRIA